MRPLKFGIYILSIIVLQSVVFARLKVFGAAPDLALVSVIIFAVLQSDHPSTFFAAGSGFIQDLLSMGIYLNTISKVVVSKIIGVTRENFVGDPYLLAFGFVAFFSFFALMVEGGALFFFFGRRIILPHFLLTIILSTIYNLAMVPVFYPVLRKLCYAE